MTEKSLYARTWKLRSELGQEKIVSADLARILAEYQVRPARMEEVATAVCEACLNAFEHGNRLNRNRQVEVRMKMTGRNCLFRVYDEGGGFDYAPLSDEQAARHQRPDSRGWGLLFISSFADRLCAGIDSGRFYIELLFQLDN